MTIAYMKITMFCRILSISAERQSVRVGVLPLCVLQGGLGVFWCFGGLAFGLVVVALLVVMVKPAHIRGLRPQHPGRLVRGCVAGVLLVMATGVVWLAVVLR